MRFALRKATFTKLKTLWYGNGCSEAGAASFIMPHNNGGYLLLRFFRNTVAIPAKRFLITLVRRHEGEDENAHQQPVQRLLYHLLLS